MTYQAEITENCCDNFQDSIESLKSKERNGVLLLKNRGNVFDRIEIESPGARMSTHIYNLVLGLVLCWGMVIIWLVAKSMLHSAIADLGTLLFVIGCLSVGAIGVILYTKSTQPLISFLGYNFVVVSFGLALSLTAYFHDPALVSGMLRIVVLTTATMTVFGFIFPRYFEKFLGGMTIAVLAVVTVAAIEILLLNNQHQTIEILVALAFCGYIGIDWVRANRIPKTLPNAVDSAAAVYMDVINLFLGLLRIPAKKKVV
jgi:FtsH-binding integral membrane protein